MSVREFLEAHGLSAYLSLFEAEQLTLDDLSSITDDDLRTSLGMTSIMDRKRFRAALAGLAGPSTALDGATRVGATLPPHDLLGGATRVGGTLPPDDMLSGATRHAGTGGGTGAPAPGGGDPTAELPQRLGSYRVLGIVGTGGMGRVVRARHVEEGWAARQGGDVAIKLVHGHLATDPSFRERFFSEADLGRRMRHPSLVPTWELLPGADRELPGARASRRGRHGQRAARASRGGGVGPPPGR